MTCKWLIVLFTTKKNLKLLKLCIRPYQVARTSINLRNFSWWGFILKMNGEITRHHLNSCAARTEPELSGSAGAQAVRRGPPDSPSAPSSWSSPRQRSAVPTTAPGPLSPLLLTALAQLHNRAAPSFLILPNYFPEPISKGSVETAHGLWCKD